MILKPDKGSGVVILNRDDYVSKVSNILNTNKFQIVNDDSLKLTYKLETKVNNFLRKIENWVCYNWWDLTSTGSRPGILYGLPKKHKPKCPIRPILLAIKTHTYNMAKYLVPLISNFSSSNYTVKDSFTFVWEIHTYANSDNLTMTSFDVESLYTNIPLIETIEIILSLAFGDCSLFLGFTRSTFKIFLELTLLDTYFLFNSRLFKQLDSLAMGLPIASMLANIFLCFHEVKWLAECLNNYKDTLTIRFCVLIILIM